MKLALRQHLDGIANPVMVKELRQTVKGRLAVMGMNLMLAILLAIFSMAALNYRDDDDFSGRAIFNGVLIVLGIICSLVIPLILMYRTGTERDPEDPDLMYIAALTPRAIILGKYAAGLVTAGLYLCVALPFMAFTYLLKGIDLLTITWGLLRMLAPALLFMQFGILLGCLPMNKKFRNALPILLFGLFWMGLRIAVLSGMRPVFVSSLWYSMAGLAGLFLFVSILIYLLSTALLKPPAANRAWWPRLYLSGTWLGSLLVMAIGNSNAPMLVWFCLFYGIGLAALLLATSERDLPGIRLRRQIPAGPSRMPAFLFFSGSASAIIWSMLLVTGTLMAGYIYCVLTADPGFGGANLLIGRLNGAAMSALSVCGYCLSMYLITRLTGRPDWMTKTWGLAFMSMMIMAAVSGIIAVSGTRYNTENEIMILSPFCGAFLDASFGRMLFLAIWAGLPFVLCIPFLYNQIRAFQPLNRETMTPAGIGATGYAD